MTLAQSITRFAEKRKTGEDIAHEFCRSLCQGGVVLHQADGPVGELFRTRCPAARTLLASDQLYKKYLPEVYAKKIETVTQLVANRRVSATINETPEMHGRPGVALLFTFSDPDSSFLKKTVLANVRVSKQCNSTTVSLLLQDVLTKYDKNLSNVSAIVSDSASYMQKITRELNASCPDFVAVHIRDICHLLNVVLTESMKVPSFTAVRELVIRVPAMNA